jgi:hypothetical protein
MTNQNFTQKTEKIPIGAAAAAFLAAGIGSLLIGLMTTGAVISSGLKNTLNWWGPVGPLSGKTGVGIIAWAISFVILHTIWKDKEVDFNKVFTVTLVLIGLGFLFTFPPVFDIFEK